MIDTNKKYRFMTLEEIMEKYPKSKTDDSHDLELIRDDATRIGWVFEREQQFLGEHITFFESGEYSEYVDYSVIDDDDLFFMKRQIFEAIVIELEEQPQSEELVQNEETLEAVPLEENEDAEPYYERPDEPFTQLFVYEEGSIKESTINALRDCNPNILPVAFRAGYREPVIITLKEE